MVHDNMSILSSSIAQEISKEPFGVAAEFLNQIFNKEDVGDIINNHEEVLTAVIFEGDHTDEFFGAMKRLQEKILEKLSKFNQQELEKIWFKLF